MPEDASLVSAEEDKVIAVAFSKLDTFTSAFFQLQVDGELVWWYALEVPDGFSGSSLRCHEKGVPKSLMGLLMAPSSRL